MIIFLKHMKKEMRKYNKKMIIVFFLSLTIYAISIFTSYIGSLLIDSIRGFNINDLFLIICVSAILFILSSIISYIASIFQINLQSGSKNEIRTVFYKNLMNADYQYMKTTSVTDIFHRMFFDVGVIIDYYFQVIIGLPINIILSIVIFFILINISLELGVVLIIFLIIQSLLLILFKKPLRIRAKNKLDSEQLLIRKVNEDFSHSELIKSLGVEEEFLLNITSFFEESKKESVRQVSFNNIIGSILGFVSQLMNYATLLLGIYLVFVEQLTIGELFIVFTVSNMFSKAFSSVLDTISNYHGVSLCFDRFNKMSSETRLNHLISNGIEFPRFNHIIISDLQFKYKAGKYIKYSNITIESNTITLLMGQNGTGKTTLLKIIKGFLKPSVGSILLNKINISDVSYLNFKKNVIYLPPNDTLIEGTLKENIVFFNDVSDSILYQTLRYCELESLVSRLSHGIDTNIGLKFKDLSSGEKRKISLARVLVRVPRVLLLDEPTMHISEDDKKNIIESLKTFQRNHGITMIIATHDKELYEIADKVITL